jgi:DNA-binding HxlR family transcriptional regulator
MRTARARKGVRGRKATHGHYCPVARSLDVLGDRWSLLVLRELLFGERRFSDLRAELAGISPTLLSERLAALADAGLVTTRELPPPAARTVYAVTGRGASAVPILQSLARFGMTLLPPPTRATRVRPEIAVHGGVAPWYDADATNGVDEVYRLVVDGTEFVLTSVRGARTAPRREPDLVLTCSARDLVAVRQGTSTIAEGVERGRVKVTGRAGARANFQRIFHLA